MRVTEDLVNRIVISSRVTSGKRREIERELRAHIEDFVTAEGKSGRDQNEIEELVLANFGDPDQIASGFAWVYRHERRILRTFTFVLLTLLLAFPLFGAILATQMGFAVGFSKPIAKVIFSRHAAIEGLDILASVAVYLGLIVLESTFQRAKFLKAAGLLAVIVVAVIALSAALGAHANFLAFGFVNGVFIRALRIYITRTIARVGFVVVCFPLAGVVLALRWLPASHITIAATCTSWLIAGAGYQLMAHLAARVDRTFLGWSERIR